MSSSNEKRHVVEGLPYAWRSMLAGGIAGSIAKTAVAPMDRVKIHFQVRNPQFSPFIGRITGVFGAIKNTYETQGITGLYRGHGATLLRVFPYAAINFYAYERFKKVLQADVNHWRRILAGSLAGCTAVSLTYPLDVLRARVAYTVIHGQARNVYRPVMEQLWREGVKASGWGLAGFYQGYLPTIIGIIPYAGTSFFTFETLKSTYCKSHNLPDGSHDIPPLTRLAFGMLAGVCAQTVTYPLDVVRRRSQLWRAAEHLPPAETWRPLDTARVMRSLFRTGGIRELFLGLSINYFKVAPSMGISFFIYDSLKGKFSL